MLHHSPYEDILPVGHQVHVHLDGLVQVLVDEYWMVPGDLDCRFNIRPELVLGIDYLHGPSSQNIGRSDQHRITYPLGYVLCLREGVSCSGFGLLYTELVHKRREPSAVLGYVHVVRICTEDLRFASFECLLKVDSQIDARLSSVLDYHPVRLFFLYHVQDVLQSKRLEV
ncbi:hypothetical protein SDC9_174285 [bioreactor metagenome]|uniref:Uncharacterized protein n=1 Tax=bioreactor metagenome TaxID=1076179 RepID=A0A645GLW4_9ZZZZ